MKTKNLFLLLAAAMFGLLSWSCDSSDDKEGTKPEVEFSVNEGTIDMTVGELLEIVATVKAGSNVTHEWKIGDNVVSQTATLSYECTVEGSFTVAYKASNDAGNFTKNFNVVVTAAENPGITFSLTESTVTKSIGESLRIIATVAEGITVTSHVWEVDGVQVSTATTLDYSIATAGEHTVKYTASFDGKTYTRFFTLNALQSEHSAGWFLWQDGQQYVITLAGDRTKALTDKGGENFGFETYTGADNQKFAKGYYFGYSNDAIAMEYYQFYNVGSKRTMDYNASMCDAEVREDGTVGESPWRGWYFAIDAAGNARMEGFMEKWDFADCYKVDIKGCIMHASDDKTELVPHFYERCSADGIRDIFEEYQALDGQYYDLKMVNVIDM